MRSKMWFPLVSVILFLVQRVHGQCPEQCLCMSQIQGRVNTSLDYTQRMVAYGSVWQDSYYDTQLQHQPHFTKVLCTIGQLKVIPDNFPLETEEITISNQDIRIIPANAFSKLTRLKKLNLDSNNITEIKAFAFKGLKDLIEISVQNNPIKTLSSFAFAGISNVSNLLLGHNQLNVIEGSAFAATERIQLLILNNNPIKTVESEAFKGLTQVRFIFLPAGVRDLKPDAFSGLEMVDKLKLAYLDLNELVAYTFRGIKKLRSLVIENSDLATIRSKAFADMTEVDEIRIANNKIDKIEENALPSRNSVKHLVLEGNHVLQIPPLSALASLQVDEVTVTKNHFPCNCRVIYLLESVLGRSEHFLEVNKCISPLTLNGQPMITMKQNGNLRQCDRNAVLEQGRREDEIRRRMKRPETTSSTMASFSSNSEDGSIRDHGGSSNSVNQFPPFSIILEESSSTSSNFSSKPIHQFNFSVLLLWLMMIVMFWSLEIYYI